MSEAATLTTRNHVPEKARRDECRNIWVHGKEVSDKSERRDGR